jgi:ribosomal-protein-alanine N-acetyltransferase
LAFAGIIVNVRFSVREYRAADFDAIYAIDQACYAADIAYSRGELRWYLSLPGAECLVAEIRGGGGGRKGNAKASRKKIAGFIITARQNIHTHIVTIDVLELHRRAGLGTSLLRRAEARVRKRGAREVWLETATNNEAAIAFWNKHGYRTRGRIRNYYPGGLDAFSMSKPLAGAAA